MKKIIFLCLCISWLFLLSGCLEKNTEHTDTLSEKQPEVIIQHATGEILIGGPDTPISGEYWYYVDKETWRKFRYITGFKYRYIYRDLWIKIETSRWYDNYSYQKYTWNILNRYQNIIYNARWPIWADYIEVFDKSPNISLEQEVINKHLVQWCKTSTWIFGKTTTYYDSMIGFDVVYLESIDLEKNCQTDKQFPEHEMPVIFVMNPKHPEYYYKLWIQDWCAPGPCSIFWNIEFF